MYDSSPIEIKSNNPSNVGVSNARNSSISSLTVIADENHSEPFEIHIGKIISANILSRSSLCNPIPHDSSFDSFSNSLALNALENPNASLSECGANMVKVAEILSSILSESNPLM